MLCEDFRCNNVRLQPFVFEWPVSMAEAFCTFEQAAPAWVALYGYTTRLDVLRQAEPSRFLEEGGARITDTEVVVHVMFIQRKPHTIDECDEEQD